MKILHPIFKQKILNIFWPSYRQKMLDMISEMEARRLVETDENKYRIPAYQKPKAQGWNYWRSRGGKIPF